MSDIIEHIKNNLIGYLITAIFSFLGFLLISIFSDVLPVILPSLQKLSISSYLKMILLLAIVFISSVVIIIILSLKSKPFQLRAMKGNFRGIPWTAEIQYYRDGRDGGIGTHICFLCPTYKTPVQLQQVGNYHRIQCNKCSAIHPIKSKGSEIYIEEAEKLIRLQILQKINSPISK